MTEKNKTTTFKLSGRRSYQIRSLMNLFRASLHVSLRRLFHGPRLPGWNWNFESATEFLRLQSVTSFNLPTPADGREYEDSLVFQFPVLEQVNIEPASAPVKGHWFQPKTEIRDVTVLYLHGGGYAYYSKAHAHLITLVALAAEAKTFALDYRLIPEHSFPAQLEDALAAYRWLLEQGIDPQRLVVMGDSAGGNLTLALLLTLRDSNAPLPALGVCIAPWTDIGNSGSGLKDNEPYDWLEKRMTTQWAEWLCKGNDPRNPIISPIHADLRGLPPIYIQAGDAEILYDMIRDFADKAQAQGANVKLDVWKNMNHDFQAFGNIIPESREALIRIGQVIRDTLS